MREWNILFNLIRYREAFLEAKPSPPRPSTGRLQQSDVGGYLQTNNLLQFLAQAEETRTTDELMEALETLLREEEIAHYALMRIPMISETSMFRILRSQMPEDWIDFYMARGYNLIDPVLRHLPHAQGAYSFTEAERAFEKDSQRRSIERLAEDRLRFGIYDGYFFPVFSHRGLTGAVVLFGARQTFSTPHLHLASAAMNRLFWRFMNLSDFPTTNAGGRTISMTRREKEVLSLLAEGLTSNEIARELAISNHTVDWYVNGLQEKLEARNRQHAVSLAFRRGMLA